MYNKRIAAGHGSSTIIASMDFETYSEAGYMWASEKWTMLPNASKYGLSIVGAAAYAQHPSTEVISFAYDLKDGIGPQLWIPGMEAPKDLFDHLEEGRLVEAWNASFEVWIWNEVCTRCYGWPVLPTAQVRDAMAKARAYALPGRLGEASSVTNASVAKDKEGDRLIKKFSMPRQPTKHDARKRILPQDDPQDVAKFYAYNMTDIAAEDAVSMLAPDLDPEELAFWQLDQEINRRGVAVDMDFVHAAIRLVEAAHAKYNAELFQLTGIGEASKVQQILGWLRGRGCVIASLDEESVDNTLSNPLLLPDCRRVLEIRQMIASAAVKKLYAIRNQVTRQERLHDLFIYHSARTGRAAGAGPQPQNLPNSGPLVTLASDGLWYSKKDSKTEWNPEAMEAAIADIKGCTLKDVEGIWGSAVGVTAACLRGAFVAAQGHDLISSDFSAIEGVVAAALAGEEWRLEVFRTHGKIYEMSASKISGIPFEEFVRHKEATGQHHPLRKKLGKVAELASGFQGWIGAWKRFGAEDFFKDDEEIKQAVMAWRSASPRIVQMWHGLQEAFTKAFQHPGLTLDCQGIKYRHDAQQDALYCTLLSGRIMTYHHPRLTPQTERAGLAISYEGWNTNPQMGAPGWVRMSTYGGKLFENVVQATARDILRHAMQMVTRGGYPIVLHVHDEIVSEIPSSSLGSVEEFEELMCSNLPAWCAEWPIRASGGWRGRRYRK